MNEGLEVGIANEKRIGGGMTLQMKKGLLVKGESQESEAW